MLKTPKKPAFKMQKVESSNIEQIGYDFDMRKLYIKFKSGKTYEYSPIIEQAYHDMMAAKSKGSYFFQNIKNNKDITFKEVTNEPGTK